MHNTKLSYWKQILTFLVLSIGLQTFYLFWKSPLVGLIVGLVLFFLVLNKDQIELFRNLLHFHVRNLRYLLPVLLEWLIAIPLHFHFLGKSKWIELSGLSTKVILNAFFTQLFLNIREEITTSFCWLMIAFLVMRLLKVSGLTPKNLKLSLLFMSIAFGLAHYDNIIATATAPGLDLNIRIIGAVFVFINGLILSLFMKTVYVKTRSIQTSILIHFLLNLRRVPFAITGDQVELFTLEPICYEALILVIYLVATIILWRKKWDLDGLNETYARIQEKKAVC